MPPTLPSTQPLDNDAIRELLTLSESRHLEFKRVSGKMVGKALETVCAFANAGGGNLILGLADPKEFTGESRLFGIEENPEAVDELQRKLLTEFSPPIHTVRLTRIPCMLHGGFSSGATGHLLLVHVERSGGVHSMMCGGTPTRMDASNRLLSASESTELSYQRGVRSATSEPVAVALERLHTQAWRRFSDARGPLTGSFPEQLLRIGLAEEVAGQVRARRAAVLLFADEPGSLLAALDSRADVRVMVYNGKQVITGATPNLRKPPKTLRGPLIDLIDAAVKTVLDELAQGLTLSSSGFRTLHAYPERVVKEALVNAIVHRDYRLNRDIFIRIFDDRIEMESPGMMPGNITPANIARMGSKARNPLITGNLREFPERPNIDPGEGVPMMFAEMVLADLYPPQYRQNTNAAVESVTVTLFNLKRPSAWDQVNAYVDEHGSIANADVVKIAKVDTLRASKLLAGWRDQGVLVPLPGRGKRNMGYVKPNEAQVELSLLSFLEDNKPKKE